ncbi:MAG: ABC transporter transmembrane domain-containing protein, partial [Oscillospiraceae bacterium]
MAKKTTKKTAPKGTLKKVLNYVGRHGFLIVLSVILAAVTVALTLYAPILIGNAIDLIVGPGSVDFAAIAKILIHTAIVIGVTALVQWLMNTINNRITYHVVRDIRNEAFRKIEILPLKYIDAHPSGEIVNRVIADADQFAEGLLMGFTQLFT